MLQASIFVVAGSSLGYWSCEYVYDCSGGSDDGGGDDVSGGGDSEAWREELHKLL